MRKLAITAVGSVYFGGVSVLVFGTVAFGELWMYRHLTLWGAYLVWTLLFLGLGAVAFLPLIECGTYRRRFPARFAIGFTGYALIWCCAYFLEPNTRGECIGGGIGSIVLAMVLNPPWMGRGGQFQSAGLLCVCSVLGYFTGAWANAAAEGTTGMLLWGVGFGLGTGAGIGSILGQLNNSTSNA